MKQTLSDFFRTGFLWRKKPFGLVLLVSLFTAYSAEAALNGNYTINGSLAASSTNYRTLAAAISDITSGTRSDGGVSNGAGVTGKVTFTLAAATHSGQFTIGAITGASATNTITFQGVNVGQVILTNAAASTTNAHTLQFSTANYVIFKYMTIRSTSTTAALPVHITGTGIGSGLIGCRILMDSTSTASSSTSFKGVNITASNIVSTGNGCGSSGTGVRDVFVDSCYISGGGIGIFTSANGTPSNGVFNNFFRHNTIVNTGLYGINISSSSAYQINYNKIILRSGGSGIYHCNGSISGTQKYEVVGNYISRYSSYGIGYLTNNNNGARGLIAHNYIVNNTGTGVNAIYISLNKNYDIISNTIWFNGNTAAGAVGIRITGAAPSYIANRVINNSIAFTGPSTAFGQFLDLGSADSVDYNVFYQANSSPFTQYATINGSTFSKSDIIGGAGFNSSSVLDDPNITSDTDPRPRNICLLGRVHPITNGIPQFNKILHVTPPPFGCAEVNPTIILDVAAIAIEQPVYPVSAGTQDIAVRVKNNGSDPVTDFDLTVNIGAQTKTISVSGIALLSCQDTLITFTGSNQFTLGTGINKLKAWTSAPNGGTDENLLNDTIARSICTPLSGTYSIKSDGTGDFLSIPEAVEVLNCGGVTGPVVFNVDAFAGVGSAVIVNVIGASATNNIVFRGTGATTSTLLNNGTNNAGLVTLKLDNAKHIRFEHLGFINSQTTTAGAIAVQINNGSDSITFRNCSFRLSAYTTTNTSALLISSNPTATGASSYSGNAILIDSCTIQNGYYTVRVEGASNKRNTNITLSNNTISGAYYYGIWGYYNTNLRLIANRIENAPNNTTSAGIYLISGNNSFLNRNYVRSGTRYGLYMSSENNGFATNSYFYNNIFSGGHTTYASGVYSIYMTGSSRCEFYHNTAILDETSLTSTIGTAYNTVLFLTSSSNNVFKNNIFRHLGTNNTSRVVYESSLTLNNTFDYNQYLAARPKAIYSNNTDTNANMSFDTWRTIFPTQNLKSRESSPRFVAPADYHLVNFEEPFYGEPLGLTDDHDGEARCSFAPTVGADESKYIDLNFSANFLVPDTFYVGSPENVLNKYGPTRPYWHEWDVNINGTVDFTTLNGVVTFNSPGTDSLRLTSYTCTSSSEVRKKVVVVNPTTKPVADFIASTYVTTKGGSINFNNLSKKGATSYKWYTSPASGVNILPNDAAFNPIMEFTNPGKYQVCLVATNAFGSDTVCKSTYIEVLEEGYICIDQGSNQEKGSLFDVGGKDFGYSKTNAGTKNRCFYLIDPCATSIEAVFNSFSLQTTNSGGVTGMDSVRLFDGATTGSPVIGAFSQFNPPIPGFAYKATSGKMLVEFMLVNNSNGATAPGFELMWNATLGTYPTPVVNLIGLDTAYTNVDYIVRARTNRTDLLFDVEMDNDPLYLEYENEIDSNFTINYSVPGTYEIIVTAKACGGPVEVRKTVIVVAPSGPPAVDFVADRLKVNVGDPVNFTDLTRQGPFQWEWEITPNNVDFLSSTDQFSQDPVVSFRSPGFYTVKLTATNDNTPPDDTASLVKIAYIEVLDYCEPFVVNQNPDIGISRVQLSTLDHSSAAGLDAYNNYFGNGKEAQLDAGKIYTIRIDRNSNLNAINWKAWIDYNNDGVYDPTTEMVTTSGAVTGKSYTGSFRVPLTANTGITSMRVGASYDNNNNQPCGVNIFGEFEDYKIVISNTPDIEKPVIVLYGADTTVEVGTSFPDPGAFATDNIDGIITPVNSSTNLDINVLGTYQVFYTVVDFAGNAADTVIRYVQVVDTQLPVITLNGINPDSVPVFGTWTDPGATATDNYYTGLTVNASSLNANVVGIQDVVYTVTDGSGNAAVPVIRKVKVYDAVAPVIALNGPDTIILDVFNTYVDPGVVITDNYYTNLNPVVNGLVNNQVLGLYEVTYNSADPSGNAAAPVKRYVRVVDRVSPKIILNGPPNINVQWSVPYVDAGAVVEDNYYSGIVPTVVSDVDYTVVGGPYLVTYSAEDPSGNKAQDVVRVVYVRAYNSLEEVEVEDAVMIFPNPTTGNVKVLLKNEQAAVITLMNGLGQLIEVPVLALNNKVYQLDLSQLAAGTYLLRVQQDNQTVTKSINLVR